MNEYFEQVEKAMVVGDRRQAIRILGQVIAGQPDNLDAWLMLAEAVEDPERKRECYQRVLRLDPSNFSAQDGLIRLAAQKARSERVQENEAAKQAAAEKKVEDTRPQKKAARPLDPARRKKLVRGALIILAVLALAGAAYLLLSGRVALPFLPKASDSLVGTWQLEGGSENLLIFQPDGVLVMRSAGMEVRYTYSASPIGALVLTDANQMSYNQSYRLKGDRLEFGEMVYLRQQGEVSPTSTVTQPGLPGALAPGVWESPQFADLVGQEQARLVVFADGTVYFGGLGKTELLNATTFRICPAVSAAQDGTCHTFIIRANGENAIIADINSSSPGGEARLLAGAQILRSGGDEGSGEAAQDLLAEWRIVQPEGLGQKITFRPDGTLTLIGADGTPQEGTFQVTDAQVTVSLLNSGAYRVHSLGKVIVLEAAAGQGEAILLVR